MQTVQVERRTSPSNGIERSLSRAVLIKTKSLPVSATTFATALTGESISTIQRGSPRISTSYKFAAPRYRLPPMALQTVQVSVEPRLSTFFQRRRIKRKRHWKIAQSCRSPTVSVRLRYHVSNSVVFVHRAGTLAKGYPLSKLFSKAEPLPFEKEKTSTWSIFSCLKHVNEMVLGDPRQAHHSDERKASPSLSSFINHSTLLCYAARALKRQFPCNKN